MNRHAEKMLQSIEEVTRSAVGESRWKARWPSPVRPLRYDRQISQSTMSIGDCRHFAKQIGSAASIFLFQASSLRYCLISSGLTSLKVKAVSAGSSTSRFPVRAAPPVPAPAPIRPPINAPLPPPAKPPINAPPPAPPPTSAPVRLPFPFLESSGVDARISYRWPFTSMWRNASPSSDAPLNRPAALALTTVPRACAPLGMTT